MKSILYRYFKRTVRILIGKKGIYCNKLGKKNHFSEGVLIYESAKIGDYNYFAPYAMINNAEIGNYCSIGPSSKIGLSDHDYSFVSTRPIVANGNGKMELFDLNNPTRIGSDVWVGANAVIKQGVFVGNGAVIGANSVVTKDVPSYAIVVGAPAKIIKYRFSKNKIEMLEKSKWFENDLKNARKIASKISNDYKEG